MVLIMNLRQSGEECLPEWNVWTNCLGAWPAVFMFWRADVASWKLKIRPGERKVRWKGGKQENE